MSASVIEAKPVLKWRVVDIAVASVIGVASALIYWFVHSPQRHRGRCSKAWCPGSPVFSTVCGCSPDRSPQSSCASRARALCGDRRRRARGTHGQHVGRCRNLPHRIGSGLFAEIAFAVFAYKKWNLGVTVLSGALSGVGCWGYSFFTHLQAIDLGGSYGVVYLITTVLSGALVAGVVMWYLYLGIARTGALDQFASGRAVRGAKH